MFSFDLQVCYCALFHISKKEWTDFDIVYVKQKSLWECYEPDIITLHVIICVYLNTDTVYNTYEVLPKSSRNVKDMCEPIIVWSPANRGIICRFLIVSVPRGMIMEACTAKHIPFVYSSVFWTFWDFRDEAGQRAKSLH